MRNIVKNLIIIMTCILGVCLINVTETQAKVISGKEGSSVSWTFDDQTGVLVVSGKGSMIGTTFGSQSFAPSIKKVLINSGITYINENAFKGCTGITEISIPGSVLTLGKNCFSGCTSLKNIYFSYGTKKIGDGAFAGCTGLKTVMVSSTISNFGSYSFYECESLETVAFAAGTQLTSVGSGVFIGTKWLKAQTEDFVCIANGWLIKYNGSNVNVTVPAKVSYIADAFAYNSSIKSVKILGGTKTISKEAFAYCKSLESVYIPASTKTVGEYSFRGCNSLKTVVMMSDSINIDEMAFVSTTNSKLGVRLYGLNGSDVKTYAFKYGFDFSKISTNIENASINKISRQFYTSKAIKPAISLWVGNYTLVNGIDYDISYSDNVNTGTCYVKITGKGDFTGTVNTSFVIYASGTCGSSLTWSYISSSGNLSIIGDGNMYDYSKLSNLPWYGFKNRIKSVSIGKSVTSIGDNAFNGCSSLSRVWGMSNVYKIGSGAFKNCSSLTIVDGCAKTVSINDYAFCNDYALTTVGAQSGEIRLNSVQYIKNYAFANVRGVKNLFTGGNINSIGVYSFKGCTALKTAYVGSGCTTIGACAFMDDTALTRINGMSGIQTIEASAFRNCTALSTVEGLSRLKSLGQSAFYKNESLTTIGSKSGYVAITGIEAVGKYTFYMCKNIKTVSTGESLSFIGDTAFRGCTKLSSITGLKNLKEIGDYAFRDDTSLKSLSGCANVIVIGDYAFYNCSALSKVGGTAQKTSFLAAQTIGKYAFGKNTAMSCFEAGKSLRSIGEYAFTQNSNLKKIYLKTIKLSEVGDNAFYKINAGAVIYVPKMVTSSYSNGVLKSKGQPASVRIVTY